MAFGLMGTLAQAAVLGDLLRLEPGDEAPVFSAAATTGKTIRLADYLGSKTVVLAFFPKAFTGG